MENSKQQDLNTMGAKQLLNDTEDRIPTNLRTLLILEVIGNSKSPLSPTQVNAKIGLPKQTIHRLCKTLVEEGFLVAEKNDTRLRPARRLRSLSSGILQNSRYHILRHQLLIDLGKEVGETVNFVMPEDEGMNYVDRVEADWPFRVQLPIGTHVPFHCTASGKTFLASLSKKARENFVNSVKLEKRTENTHVDPEKLLQELKKVRAQGYAVDNEEFMEGMIAIAVPVLNNKEHYTGALAFHGPTVRLDKDLLISRRGKLIYAAERLRELMYEIDDEMAF